MVARKPEVQLKVGAALLTRLGREIFPLAGGNECFEHAQEFAEKLPKVGVEQIFFIQTNEMPVLLYQKPPEEAAAPQT